MTADDRIAELEGLGRQQRQQLEVVLAYNAMLQVGQEQVLAFLDGFAIPFHSSQAERDLRMLKVQQKISVSFRSAAGATAFACIRGYLSTLCKQGVALLSALEALFIGQPLYPTVA